MPRNVSTAARGSGERRFSRSGARATPATCRRAPARRRSSAAAAARAAPAAAARALDQPAERRVGGVLRDPLAERERQVPEVQVARPPAEHRRVQRDDDGSQPAASARPSRLSTSSSDVDQYSCIHRGASPIAAAVLHRHRRLVGEDHRHADRRRGPGDRQVGLRVHQLQGADRPEQQRRRQPSSEQLDGGVPRLTSRSTRGTTAHRSNAARSARWVSSSPAPPAT